MKRINFRKRVFHIAKQLGRTLSRASQMYKVQEDFNKLKEVNKNKLTGGVKLYKEIVTGFTSTDDQAEIFATFKEQIAKQGFFFLPLFESKNFYQGLMFRPRVDSDDTSTTWIDQAWNRIFYPKHCVNLFSKGYDPTLAGVADILYDMRSGLCCNWDSRHRKVGEMSADKDQLPEYGWNNALVIKQEAPTNGPKAIFADEVACYLFEVKNDTPKPLTPVERFVAEFRTNDPGAIATYAALKYAKIKLGTSVLPDLEKGDDARTLTGLAQFRNDYLHVNLGNGDNLIEASGSLKRAWSGAQLPEFSVYLILGYCHLLQLHNRFNGEWGFDNSIMIKALKWAYESKGLTAKDYCTPRASGKPYETVAFHFLRLAYNDYVVSPQYIKENKCTGLQLHYRHFGFEKSFLATIGVDPKLLESPVEEDNSDIEESLDQEPVTV